MKRVWVLTVFILVILAVCILRPWSKKDRATVKDISATQTPALSPTPKTVAFENQIFAYAYIKASPKDISLIPNYAERLDTSSLMTQHTCRGAVNGGFYDTDNRPLGLFHTDGTTLSAATENALFNGFFSLHADDSAAIGSVAPTDMRIALQTGPVLVAGGEPLALRIKNDESARRMVAAIGKDSAVLFISLYSPEASFGGPLLGDVPKLVETISQLESLAVVSAINLDGGSASAFYNDTVSLSELTPVGSLFCVQHYI